MDGDVACLVVLWHSETEALIFINFPLQASGITRYRRCRVANHTALVMLIADDEVVLRCAARDGRGVWFQAITECVDSVTILELLDRIRFVLCPGNCQNQGNSTLDLHRMSQPFA